MWVAFWIVISEYRLIMYYICTKFRENISEGLRVTDRTRFPNKIFLKGHKSVSGVMVLNLCTSSDNALYLYKVL